MITTKICYTADKKSNENEGIACSEKWKAECSYKSLNVGIGL